ncbi:MAG TPA: MarR family transcriptional regulator [Blastocatellia bacterium]|nr:MarR family transcriptional regulator [Blastocatellia bacterium]
MKTREAARQVQELYPRIFHACHSRHVRDTRARRTLSSHQASILDHLDDVEPTSLAGLAKHMGVTPSTMSIAVERLVSQGYVHRERHTGDRRVVNIRLSKAGLRIKEAQSVLDPARLESMLGRLTPPEREEAVRGLAILARAAREEMHAQSTQRVWAANRPEHRTNQ